MEGGVQCWVYTEGTVCTSCEGLRVDIPEPWEESNMDCERERETERERQRERQRQRDRETERQREREGGREGERES